MTDDELNQDLPESQPQQADDTAAELPERLRVHTLARMLGTTSKRVLDVLADIDGRSRSAQSSIDQAEAIRVREVLAAEPGTGAAAPASAPAGAAEQPAYMPLFVAPQTVPARRAVDPAPAEATVATELADGADDATVVTVSAPAPSASPSLDPDTPAIDPGVLSALRGAPQLNAANPSR